VLHIDPIPSLAIATTTDGGYIYKTGDNTFRVWFHTSKPVYAGIIIDGVFRQGPAPFGPTSVWDFGPPSRGQYGGSEVRLDGLSATWAVSGTVQATQPGPSLKKSKKRKARQTQKLCRSRARKIKNANRRHAALRRCAKKKRKKTPRARTRAAAASGLSPFASTGCGGSGKWGFEARMTYKDGSKETLDSSLDCGSGTGGIGGGGGGSGLPCVPVPGVPPPTGCGGAFATTRL
jgi:hypothetical protein